MNLMSHRYLDNVALSTFENEMFLEHEKVLNQNLLSKNNKIC